MGKITESEDADQMVFKIREMKSQEVVYLDSSLLFFFISGTQHREGIYGLPAFTSF